MRLHTQPVPTAVATCPAPSLWVDSLGSTAVKMRWSPGYQDTSWTLECIADGDTAWHTSGLVWGDTAYTITGLRPGSDYTFRLTAFCADTFTTVLKHVLTNCTPTTLPYAENFDSAWFIPDCWNVVPGAAGDKPILSSRHHSGSRAVQLKGGAVVLPAFDATPDSLELYFWALSNGGSNRNLYVGMVADPLDMSTFVPIDTVEVPNYSIWNAVAVRTDRYSRTAGRLAIATADPLNPHMYIDDIDVSHIVPCEAMAPVIMDWVTDTSALVRWNDTVGAVYYDVAYGPMGFVPDSTTIVTDIRTDSLLLTGLSPYTQYDVYVRPECGSYITHWSPVTTFRTLCSLLDTLPYTEDFDSYTGYPRPTELPCWQGRVGLNAYVGNLVGGAHSGSCVMAWEWSIYETVIDHKIVLPAINTAVLPMGRLQLSFWAKNVDNTYNRYDPARVVVGVMDDPAVDSTFQAIDTLNIVGYEWSRYDVPLTSYSGIGKYIAILSCPSIGSRNNWYAFIDDVLIDLAPPCANVTGMTLTGLTSTSVTLAWNAADSGTRWQAYIDSSATATPTADTTVLTVPGCTFGGLVAEQPYYVWVRAICPRGDTSGWEGPMQVVSGTWNMRVNKNDTLTMCGVSLYDDGGPNADFSAQHSSIVIFPDMPGHLVSISGYCNIGSISALTIYDGAGTSGSILWTKTYNNPYAANFGPIISDSGPLTLVFDGSTSFSTYYEGFNLQVSCVPDTCIIHHLRLDPSVPVSDSVLALTWQCNGASLYEVEYGPVGFAPGTGTVVSTTTNSLSITGLVSLDRREVYVRSICGVGDTGDWVRGIFTTQPCSNAVFRENFDSTMYASDNTSSPIGFNGAAYSYTQTLIDSAHLAGLEGGITALAFRPTNIVEGDHQNNITVYLANVPDSLLMDGHLVPDAGHRFVKVIDSANFCHTATTDWQIFPFDRPFMWDGHQNLLVAVLRDDGGSGLRVEYACHYRYNELVNRIFRGYIMSWNSPINIDSARTYTTAGYGNYLIGDIRLYTNTCALPLCAAPKVDSVVTSYESATLSWRGYGNDYQLTYAGAGLVSVTGNSYTLTGLQPATTYRVSIRQNCSADSLGYSDWVTVDFTTDSFLCLPPDSLTVSDITYHSATFHWQTYDSSVLCQLHLFTEGEADIVENVVSSPHTVVGLQPATTYYAAIRTFCGTDRQIMGLWSDTIAFSTPVCPDVTELTATDITTTSVTLRWDANTLAQDYIVEYGVAGFLPGTGADTVVSGNICTITHLQPATAYDFHVRTRCAPDWLSAETSTLTNVVTRPKEGIADPTHSEGRLRINLIPNPAYGTVGLSIVGLPVSLSGQVQVSIADLTGRDVLTRLIECDGSCEHLLDISPLTAGAYFVRISTERGTMVRKLIIK